MELSEADLARHEEEVRAMAQRDLDRASKSPFRRWGATIAERFDGAPKAVYFVAGAFLNAVLLFGLIWKSWPIIGEFLGSPFPHLFIAVGVSLLIVMNLSAFRHHKNGGHQGVFFWSMVCAIVLNAMASAALATQQESMASDEVKARNAQIAQLEREVKLEGEALADRAALYSEPVSYYERRVTAQELVIAQREEARDNALGYLQDVLNVYYRLPEGADFEKDRHCLQPLPLSTRSQCELIDAMSAQVTSAKVELVERQGIVDVRKSIDADQIALDEKRANLQDLMEQAPETSGLAGIVNQVVQSDSWVVLVIGVIVLFLFAAGTELILTEVVIRLIAKED